MEIGCAALELSHHPLNSPVNRGMIRAVSRDKLQDDRGKCTGRKFSVWDLHLRANTHCGFASRKWVQ